MCGSNYKLTPGAHNKKEHLNLAIEHYQSNHITVPSEKKKLLM